MERLKEHAFLDSLIDKDQIFATRGGERLENNQMLVDLAFPRGEIAVTYSKEGISFRESKASLELEADFFSMFDYD